MLDQRLLLVRNPGVKTCRLGCVVCGFAHDAIRLSISLPKYCTAYGRTRQGFQPVSRGLTPIYTDEPDSNFLLGRRPDFRYARWMAPLPSPLEYLHQTSRIVSSVLSLDEILKELVGVAVQVTGCDACLVYLVEPLGEIVLRASQLPHASEIGNIRMKLGEGITGWV